MGPFERYAPLYFLQLSIFWDFLKKRKSFNFSSFIQEAGLGVKCVMWGPIVVLNTEYGPIWEVRPIILSATFDILRFFEKNEKFQFFEFHSRSRPRSQMLYVGTHCGPKYRIWAHLRGTPHYTFCNFRYFEVFWKKWKVSIFRVSFKKQA
jgi:hypothetical protein